MGRENIIESDPTMTISFLSSSTIENNVIMKANSSCFSCVEFGFAYIHHYYVVGILH